MWRNLVCVHINACWYVNTLNTYKCHEHVRHEHGKRKRIWKNQPWNNTSLEITKKKNVFFGWKKVVAVLMKDKLKITLFPLIIYSNVDIIMLLPPFTFKQPAQRQILHDSRIKQGGWLSREKHAALFRKFT